MIGREAGQPCPASRILIVSPPLGYGVTVKTPALVALPPGVVIAMCPVAAPVGTVAVTCVSEFTVKVVAFAP